MRILGVGIPELFMVLTVVGVIVVIVAAVIVLVVRENKRAAAEHGYQPYRTPPMQQNPPTYPQQYPSVQPYPQTYQPTYQSIPQPTYPQAYLQTPPKKEGFGIRFWRALYPMLVLFAVQGFAAVFIGIIAASDPNMRFFADDSSMLFVFLGALLVSQVISIPLFIAFRKMDINRLITRGCWKKYRRPAFGKLVGCLGLGVAMALFALVGFQILGVPDDGTQSYLFSLNPVMSLIALGLLGPAMEELAFRVVLYGRLREWMSPISAGLLSALVFTLAHGNVTQGITAFFYGLALALVYERCKTFWAPFLLHVGINSTVVLMAVIPGASAVLLSGLGLVITVTVAAAVIVALVIFFYRSNPVDEIESTALPTMQ